MVGTSVHNSPTGDRR